MCHLTSLFSSVFKVWCSIWQIAFRYSTFPCVPIYLSFLADSCPSDQDPDFSSGLRGLGWGQGAWTGTLHRDIWGRIVKIPRETRRASSMSLLTLWWREPWRNECKSKSHKDGTLLTKEAECYRSMLAPTVIGEICWCWDKERCWPVSLQSFLTMKTGRLFWT